MNKTREMTSEEKQAHADKQAQLKALNKKYQQRISWIREAQTYRDKGDFANAVKYYNMYLQTMAQVKEVPIDFLAPKLFDKERDAAEMLMIAQVFWDLVKLYDQTPKLRDELLSAMNKFVNFSVGTKHHNMSAEMLRRHINKNQHQNKMLFQNAYEKLYNESNKCYVSTYCFSSNHWVTQSLRKLRNELLSLPKFMYFIEKYYLMAPMITENSKKYPLLGIPLKLICTPLLYIISLSYYFWSKIR